MTHLEEYVCTEARHRQSHEAAKTAYLLLNVGDKRISSCAAEAQGAEICRLLMWRGSKGKYFYKSGIVLLRFR